MPGPERFKSGKTVSLPKISSIEIGLRLSILALPEAISLMKALLKQGNYSLDLIIFNL